MGIWNAIFGGDDGEIASLRGRVEKHEEMCGEYGKVGEYAALLAKGMPGGSGMTAWEESRFYKLRDEIDRWTAKGCGR
jgi:hypothetical protein